MLIREMRSEDLELIIIFEQACRSLDNDNNMPFNEKEYRIKFTRKKIEDYINSKSFLYIKDNVIIGKIDTIVDCNLTSFKIVGYIDWVTVLKPYRKQGIAKELFAKAEEHLKDQKCELFYLFVENTEVAKGFYKKIELTQENVIRGYKLLK